MKAAINIASQSGYEDIAYQGVKEVTNNSPRKVINRLAVSQEQ